MLDEEKLNDLHLEDAMPPTGLIDMFEKIIDTHPLLTFIFCCSILYLIVNDFGLYKNKK